MHEQRKDYTAKGIHKETHRNGGYLWICIAICVNTDHYGVILIVRAGDKWFGFSARSKMRCIQFKVRKNPSVRVLAVADAVGGSRNGSFVFYMCGGLHPHHMERVQSPLLIDLLARVHFKRWYLDQCCQDAHFPSYILFLDEEYFMRECVFTHHIAHLCSEIIPIAWEQMLPNIALQRMF